MAAAHSGLMPPCCCRIGLLALCHSLPLLATIERAWPQSKSAIHSFFTLQSLLLPASAAPATAYISHRVCSECYLASCIVCPRLRCVAPTLIMRVCLPRSSSSVRHYAPPPVGPPVQSTRQKRTLSDMSQEHARKATNLSIDLPPPPAAPHRPPSPVLPSPLPSAQSSASVSSASSSPLSCQPVPPPAPARKRRAAAVAAESAIRQQLQPDSAERITGPPHSLQQLVCDEDESTIDSCVSAVSSTLSTVSHAPTSAYVTPEPRKRRSRRRRQRAEADAAAPAADGSTSSSTDEVSGVVIPTYLPPAILPPVDEAATTPSLRRSTRRLPKAHSLVSSTHAPTAPPRRRATSLPSVKSAHPIFHDFAITTSVLSSLPLSSFLHLRAVSTSFLRPSYTPAAWYHQHVTVCDAASLVRLRSSTALFALLPSLTVNLVSCPTLCIDAELRALLSRLPSLRSLRLVNCMKLTKLGVNAVLYCGALTELTVQNCGSLQARCLSSLLEHIPCLGSVQQLQLLPDVPRDAADDAALSLARTDALAAYRSTAYVSALSSTCFRWDDEYHVRRDTPRPLYDHTRLVRLDLTKFRNWRDESLLTFRDEHWRSFVSLRHLNLRGCRELTDESMSCVADMPLLSLDLSFCVQLNNLAIERLANRSRPLRQTLKSLTLTSAVMLTDGACEHLAAFVHLSHLVLSQLPRLTDHGLIQLQRGPACLKLCSVDVSWCERLVGDWLVSVGEGWTRQENERRMGADFLDYYDGSHSGMVQEEEDELTSEGHECDSDGDGVELADARREAAVIARRRAAQRERRRLTPERRVGQGQLATVAAAEESSEMWSALRYVDVRYCHGVDVGSKVILARLRPDIQLVWR